MRTQREMQGIVDLISSYKFSRRRGSKFGSYTIHRSETPSLSALFFFLLNSEGLSRGFVEKIKDTTHEYAHWTVEIRAHFILR